MLCKAPERDQHQNQQKFQIVTRLTQSKKTEDQPSWSKQEIRFYKEDGSGIFCLTHLRQLAEGLWLYDLWTEHKDPDDEESEDQCELEVWLGQERV